MAAAQVGGGRRPNLVLMTDQGHDICEWTRQYPGTAGHREKWKYPPAPGNMAVDPLTPEAMQYHRKADCDLMSQGVGIASHWQRDDFRV